MKPHKITEIIRETDDVITLRFLDENGQHANYTAGQYVTVLFPDLDVPEGKAYSLSSAPYDPHMAITVKKIGAYSTQLHSLKVGDELLVSQPYGFLNPEFSNPLIMIAGGVGVSPLLSIIRDTLNRDPARWINLLYSNKTADDIIFAGLIDKLEQEHANFRVQHFITRQKKLPAKYRKGRIKISEMLTSDKPTPEAFYFICGREDFVGDMWRDLIAAGIPENKIATETFY